MQHTDRSADHAATTEPNTVHRWVSRVTLVLLALLTVASVQNIHDMAQATHAANGASAWIVSVAVGGTLSVLAYVASITDGRTRWTAIAFASFAAVVSTALQVSLFQARGAQLAVALAFGLGVPFFEVALALTDSMLRRYSTPVATPSHDTARNTVPDTVSDAMRTTVAHTVPDTMQHPVADTVRTTVPVNVSQLAKQLGVSRSTVYRRLQNGELSLNGATGD